MTQAVISWNIRVKDDLKLKKVSVESQRPIHVADADASVVNSGYRHFMVSVLFCPFGVVIKRIVAQRFGRSFRATGSFIELTA
jgi:hypothetical protein